LNIKYDAFPTDTKEKSRKGKYQIYNDKWVDKKRCHYSLLSKHCSKKGKQLMLTDGRHIRALTDNK